MLLICSIDVPSPCDTMPPQPFSLKEITAKPTICAQQPATAAPPASPVSPSTEHIAAEEIGSVSATPTITDTRMPIKNGRRFVASIISRPSAFAAVPIGGAMSFANATPTSIVTPGVTLSLIHIFAYKIQDIFD